MLREWVGVGVACLKHTLEAEPLLVERDAGVGVAAENLTDRPIPLGVIVACRGAVDLNRRCRRDTTGPLKRGDAKGHFQTLELGATAPTKPRAKRALAMAAVAAVTLTVWRSSAMH